MLILRFQNMLKIRNGVFHIISIVTNNKNLNIQVPMVYYDTLLTYNCIRNLLHNFFEITKIR